ncbi:MAG TPA: TetR/AcrR family transcriptional regulator [Niabella sp.]|nr:TetR/AcrR family transcriptional regulator [Niabella sp.]
MARSIDKTKIENIRNSAMELVVEKGYGGASISEIAKKAAVADGYLYRFYKSKSELVNDLLYSLLKELVDNMELFISDNTLTLKDAVQKLIRLLFEMAHQQPEKIKFLFVLMHDYNFEVHPEQRKKIFDLCRKAKNKGIKTKEISSAVDEDSIYLFTVSMPIQFLNLRLKNFFGKSSIGEKEIKTAINLSSKILQ